jgi:hypothetical protein
MEQSPALGLTTVPILDPQVRVGQLYPPITHPTHTHQSITKIKLLNSTLQRSTVLMSY